MAKVMNPELQRKIIITFIKSDYEKDRLITSRSLRQQVQFLNYRGVIDLGEIIEYINSSSKEDTLDKACTFDIKRLEKAG